jgi:cell division transport system permease protein
MGRLTFFLSEAFRALRRSAAPSVAAIVTVAVTTLLLGVLIPVLRASDSTASSVRDQISLEVFLYLDATQKEIDALEEQLVEVPHVESVAFVSPAQAKKELAGELEGDLAGSIGELNRNPLPPSFDIELDDPDNLEAVRSALVPPDSSGNPTPISSIIDPPVGEDRENAKKIREVTGALRVVLIVIAGLLLIASLMLVANTIRLSIYARRREVEVMSLVGATRWFIRWPFVIEGVIVGVVGATIAVAILWLGKVTIVDPLADDFNLIDNFATTGFAPLVALLLGSAVLVSALGSGITLRRFLRI